MQTFLPWHIEGVVLGSCTIPQRTHVCGTRVKSPCMWCLHVAFPLRLLLGNYGYKNSTYCPICEFQSVQTPPSTQKCSSLMLSKKQLWVLKEPGVPAKPSETQSLTPSGKAARILNNLSSGCPKRPPAKPRGDPAQPWHWGPPGWRGARARRGASCTGRAGARLCAAARGVPLEPRAGRDPERRAPGAPRRVFRRSPCVDSPTAAPQTRTLAPLGLRFIKASGAPAARG